MPTPSKVALWEPSLGRLELGDRPYVVESFQIGSPDIRENVKNRALSDGVFDDTLYHGASAITVSTRLGTSSRGHCGPDDPLFSTLRDALVAYCHPRLRPRLFWRYPGDEVGRWATVRGVSWPFVVDGPSYPMLSVQFKNALGSMMIGDPEAAPNSASSLAGSQAAGRVYNLTFDRDYPNVAGPAGTTFINNTGNTGAGWRMVVEGPFDAGATVTLGGSTIEFNQALLSGQNVTLRTLDKTILRENGNSYYPFTNFGEWDWDDLMLQAGETPMVFDGFVAGVPSGFATIEWFSTII